MLMILLLISSVTIVCLFQNIYSEYIDFQNKHVQELDISPTSCSFNAGVYVTDLEYWRKYNITQKLQYWMELNTK